MSKFRWQLPALLVAALTMVLGLAVTPAQGAGGLSATFTKGSDWGTGYGASYRIANGSTAAITSWTVEFTLPAGAKVVSLWDGSYTTAGQKVTVKSTWNGAVARGASVEFGFNVTYTGAYAAPTGCLLNGASCESGGTPPTTTTTTSTTTTTTRTTTTTPPVTTTTTSTPPQPGGKVNLAYFTNWGVYDHPYYVKNIATSGSVSKLTHINYAFGNVANGQCVVGDPEADYTMAFDAASSVDGVADTGTGPAGNFNQLRKLKRLNPNLKVIWSFGGWTWSGGFPQAAQNPTAFADSCYKLVEDPRWADVFDGIDIDWEYPNSCGLSCDTSGPAAYRNLMSALRARFGATNLVTSAITADGTAGGKIDAADYAGASQYVNWYNVMTYDFFGDWSPQGPTAPHSPLTSYTGIPAAGFYSDASIQKLKSKGVPSAKLLLGIGFYGRGWTGVTQAAPGGTATGAAPGRDEAGMENYSILKTRCPVTGTVAGTAYAKCGSEWWSYDTPSTIAGKMAYAKTQGLGGAFAWELSGDTTDGELLTAMRNGLQ